MNLGLILLASCAALAPVEDRPIAVRVLVLNFDPVVPGEGGRRLHEVGRWQDPRKLAKEYQADVERASRGFVRYEVVDWKDVEELPAKVDGFRYGLAEYLRCRKANKGWHEPDGCDYPRLIAEHGVAGRVDRGEVDEVWLFGPPYSGFHEAAMAGPGAFDINGGVYDKVAARRPFALMGFNYERGVAEMLHDLAHRTESTMARVFGGWKAGELTTDWARFAACARKAGAGKAGCGDCHFPPNADADYDYSNPRAVVSTADDWLDYPKLTGKTSRVDRETWGGPDYHRNYLVWWFRHLPHATGVHPGHGRENNWWRYVFDFGSYDAAGKRVAAG